MSVPDRPDYKGADVVQLRRPGTPPPLFGDQDKAAGRDQSRDRPGEVVPAAGRDVEHHVLEGEILDEEKPARVPALRRPWFPATREDHDDPKAVVVAQIAMRAGWAITRGHAEWTRRAVGALTYATYREQVRSARASGDVERLAEWLDKYADAKRTRWDRITTAPRTVVAALQTVGLVVAIVAVVLVVVGIAVAARDGGMTWESWWGMIWATVGAVGMLAQVVLWGALVVVPVAWLRAAYRAGRDVTMPAWLGVPDPAEAEGGIVVTADTVVLALQHLRIPELKRAFRDGWVPKFHQAPVRDGRGYHMVLDLPLGVTAGMVCDQRPVLARNLHRAEVEVWPGDAEKAGTGPAGALDVWVADSGALSKPAPEYPLLNEGTADVFEGVPIGVSPRGDALMAPIVANNFVVGGQMGQGKSNACRVAMLGAALDPLAELWVFVFAGNGDFDAYRPRLARYHRGATDEVAAAGLASLHDLYAEVARREDRLADLGAKKVTRQLAMQYPDLRPRLALFSECHELFGHKEYGEEAAEVAVQTLRRARKTGIWLGFDTQSSRADAIPPKIVELVSVNACFYVKTWRSNDGFLGDGSFQAGIRATELRPGRDRGTSLITGVSDAMFELLKWYFIEVNDDTGFDAAADVIARAMTLVDPATPVESTAPRRPVEKRDLLDDLDEVLGVERAQLVDVPALLRDLAPNWGPYRNLTGTKLGEILAGLGVRIYKTGNRPQFDPADVRRVLAEKSTADLGEG
jgi:S-DNA-T family DNA segregation ATPase FtsK/SpoIIIE